MKHQKYTVSYKDSINPGETWKLIGLCMGQATKTAAQLFLRRGLRKATEVTITPIYTP